MSESQAEINKDEKMSPEAKMHTDQIDDQTEGFDEAAALPGDNEERQNQVDTHPEDFEEVESVKDGKTRRILKIILFVFLFGGLITILTVPAVLTKQEINVDDENSTTKSTTTTTTTTTTEMSSLPIIEDYDFCKEITYLIANDNGYNCEIYCKDPFERCISEEEGCYQFGDHCFRSVGSDWSWCAHELNWIPCEEDFGKEEVECPDCTESSSDDDFTEFLFQ